MLCPFNNRAVKVITTEGGDISQKDVGDKVSRTLTARICPVINATDCMAFGTLHGNKELGSSRMAT